MTGYVIWESDAYESRKEIVREPSVAKDSVSFLYLNEDTGEEEHIILKDNGEGQYVGSMGGYRYRGIRANHWNMVTVEGDFVGSYEGTFLLVIILD